MSDKLTPAQLRTLQQIRAHGYAISSPFAMRYSCGGERLRYDVVQALRRAGRVRGVAVRPGVTVHGYTNDSRVTRHIVVPTEEPQ